jgi:nanoRNase/pAp phosphatase (c-di-AMP/oligoRNAs hydrolase)
MNYICFYHSPCNDGEMAKNIWKHKYPKTRFFPWIHSKASENVKFLQSFTEEHIVFLDYCPKKEYLKNNNKYLIIDHHKNAISQISEDENIKMYCDVERAGCMLTWDYLYPDTIYPISIFHIGNADLFNFNHINTEPFSLAYRDYNLNFNDLINLKNTDEYYHKIVADGVKHMSKYKFEALAYFYTSTIDYEKVDNKEFKVITIYCDKYHLYKYLIEIAKIQYKQCNILRIQKNKGDNITYSLRSLDGSPVDGIARKYGGNGHPMAAGYTIHY